METCRAVVGAHALRDAGKGSDDDVSDAIAQLERCLMQQPKAARGTSSARAGRDFRRARRADKLEPGEFIANNNASELVSIYERDWRLRLVPRFCQSRSREMASRNEYSFGRRTQRAPEVVDLRAADRVPPPLYLRLHVSSSKELILLVHIGVYIYATISWGSGDRNFHESTPFEYKPDEMFEVMRCELEQPHPQSLELHGCCSFGFVTALRKRRDFTLQAAQRTVQARLG
jgi:hypothetical protein